MSKATTSKQEVAAITTVLSVALRGDSTLQGALSTTLQNASGEVAARLQLALRAIELGQPSNQALALAIKDNDDSALEELVNKLQLSNQLGSRLAEQLEDFAKSLHSQIARAKLARATAAETKMLVPLIFMILPVTVLFALYPSFQILNLQLEGM
jgi:tight adherence protein C